MYRTGAPPCAGWSRSGGDRFIAGGDRRLVVAADRRSTVEALLDVRGTRRCRRIHVGHREGIDERPRSRRPLPSRRRGLRLFRVHGRSNRQPPDRGLADDLVGRGGCASVHHSADAVGTRAGVDRRPPYRVARLRLPLHSFDVSRFLCLVCGLSNRRCCPGESGAATAANPVAHMGRTVSP